VGRVRVRLRGPLRGGDLLTRERRRGGRVDLGTLPREAAGTLVSLVRAYLTTADHADGCDMSGETETCPECMLFQWAGEVNVDG
jgi:hypothetical protein